ncbi:Gfo/Idh/MocA family protein [Novipirellula artificiosorum]|uniref:Alpha-N-acetylgalactosaminidase n=1 Tax=Novipirellula artificiosorum TaxID=2528016 RepID=A0A5C6DYR2_9BACT|nr:Gfo/Idh/MocA family oxidoreductase [Novipirellula artificiosorum]TWU40977.1 Alpha-N-acetylgalactosaminidase [Novipirellula artificiosorum]
MTDKHSSDSSASPQTQNRRRFIKQSGAASAAVASAMATTRMIRGDEPQAATAPKIRIGLVGAGGRGAGAVTDSLAINDNVQLVAIADLEAATGESLRRRLKRNQDFGDKIAVEDTSLHSGLDGYKRVLDDPNVDLVLFATPPGFRPSYVLEAVEAGKHVFAEKPTCVDPVGHKACIEADEKARANKTAIVTGTQYRRQTNYVEAIRRIHEGAIGEIISGTARYCSNGIWYKQRKEGMSDMEYQLYNWMHFIWLSGDQITEQAVHNIDTINWIMGGPPETAYGGGGRFTRPEDSEMWDNVAVDYVYPGNRVISFMCRQIPSTQGDNSNVIYGSEGIATIKGGNSGASIVDRNGKTIWEMPGDIGAAYKQEHKDLVDSILAEKPIVELRDTADSSLTAVLGRMAAYTGQKVSWDFLTNESKLDLFPKDLNIKGPGAPVGFAVPGQQKLV